eukprot:364013-Chlamydomonas_euryale.AAC.13
MSSQQSLPAAAATRVEACPPVQRGPHPWQLTHSCPFEGAGRITLGGQHTADKYKSLNHQIWRRAGSGLQYEQRDTLQKFSGHERACMPPSDVCLYARGSHHHSPGCRHAHHNHHHCEQSICHIPWMTAALAAAVALGQWSSIRFTSHAVRAESRRTRIACTGVILLAIHVSVGHVPVDARRLHIRAVAVVPQPALHEGDLEVLVAAGARRASKPYVGVRACGRVEMCA